MDLIGKVLGDRYEIVKLIGSGGMARVYKAKCRQLNRYVAVKVLRDELKDDTEFVNKFKTEAMAAASLAHPNIVSVFDSGEDNGIYYFVMEYVEGYTLKQYIARKGAIEWHEASEIALGICAAIEQA
ncbi:MAG: protein kinase, partial [Bacillota bacterium]|nr:protein kinase [Bacillota bacterium]